MTTLRKSGAARLREMLADPKKPIIACPGVYDGLTTRIALKEGFECLYMTGAGTSISRLGMADLGLATLNDMRDNVQMISQIDPSVPLIADADTGYGNAIMVGRTIQSYVLAGVAGLHLEDQVVNKRCGHLMGKELVSEKEYLIRIQAAVNMRAKLESDIVIIARTDALQSLGFEEAISRMKKAIAIGADVAFIEALKSIEQARQVCEIFEDTPVMYNMVQGGVSPDLTVKEAEEIGFRIIIFPGLCLGAAYSSVSKAMKRFKKTGDVEKSDFGPVELFQACGLDELLAFDKSAADH